MQRHDEGICKESCCKTGQGFLTHRDYCISTFIPSCGGDGLSIRQRRGDLHRGPLGRSWREVHNSRSLEKDASAEVEEKDAPEGVEKEKVAPIEVEAQEDLEELRHLKSQPAESASKPASEKKEKKVSPMMSSSKAMAKPKTKPKVSGLTHGGYSIMTQQLVQQKPE